MFPKPSQCNLYGKLPFLAKPTFLAEKPRTDLANTPWAQFVWTLRRHSEPLLAGRQDYLLSIHVSLSSLPETIPTSYIIARSIPQDIRFNSYSRFQSWNHSSEHCSSR